MSYPITAHSSNISLDLCAAEIVHGIGGFQSEMFIESRNEDEIKSDTRVLHEHPNVTVYCVGVMPCVACEMIIAMCWRLWATFWVNSRSVCKIQSGKERTLVLPYLSAWQFLPFCIHYLAPDSRHTCSTELAFCPLNNVLFLLLMVEKEQLTNFDTIHIYFFLTQVSFIYLILKASFKIFIKVHVIKYWIFLYCTALKCSWKCTILTRYKTARLESVQL